MGMAKGVIMVFSRPASADQEEAYNEWYSGIHFDELTAPPGVRSARRYRLYSEQVPGNPDFPYSYLSVYDLDDLARDYPAMRSIQTTPSEAIDPDRRQVIFELVHSYDKSGE